ncbi:hypothetical protein BGZ80_008495, partial [Entomortierella chlamydospora]
QFVMPDEAPANGVNETNYRTEFQFYKKHWLLTHTVRVYPIKVPSTNTTDDLKKAASPV